MLFDLDDGVGFPHINHIGSNRLSKSTSSFRKCIKSELHSQLPFLGGMIYQTWSFWLRTLPCRWLASEIPLASIAGNAHLRLTYLQAHQLGSKHRERFRLSNYVVPDIGLTLNPAPAPSNSPKWKYSNFCGICWLEHASCRELTEHCLSKSHAVNYYKLQETNPLRFDKLKKHNGAFECFVCKEEGKNIRFPHQSGLEVPLLILMFPILPMKLSTIRNAIK